MAQKTGALIFDETADRYDIRFDIADYYGGLHCGECMDVAVIKQGHLLYSGPTVEITGTKGLEEVFMEMNSDENFITSIEK